MSLSDDIDALIAGGGSQTRASEAELRRAADSASQLGRAGTRLLNEWRGDMAEYKGVFGPGTPFDAAFRKRGIFLLSEKGGGEVAGQFASRAKGNLARGERATERRNRGLGIDPSSGRAQAGQRGREILGQQVVSEQGNRGFQEAAKEGERRIGIFRDAQAPIVDVRRGQAGLQAQGLGVQTQLGVGSAFAGLSGTVKAGRVGIGQALGSITSVGGAEGGFAGRRVEDDESVASETDDRVPAQLSAGEYVATAESVKFHGQWLYDWLEEAARRNIPGIPKFMQKLDMSEVPTRTAGEEPNAPQRETEPEPEEKVLAQAGGGFIGRLQRLKFNKGFGGGLKLNEGFSKGLELNKGLKEGIELNKGFPELFAPGVSGGGLTDTNLIRNDQLARGAQLADTVARNLPRMGIFNDVARAAHGGISNDDFFKIIQRGEQETGHSSRTDGGLSPNPSPVEQSTSEFGGLPFGTIIKPLQLPPPAKLIQITQSGR